MICCTERQPGCNRPLVNYEKVANLQWADFRRSFGLDPISTAEALIQIEQFVDAVLNTNRAAVKFRFRSSGVVSPGPTVIGRNLFKVLLTLGMFNAACEYSPRVYAFLEACWSLEVFIGIDYVDICANPVWSMHARQDELNAVLDKIRMSARQPWFWS